MYLAAGADRRLQLRRKRHACRATGGLSRKPRASRPGALGSRRAAAMKVVTVLGTRPEIIRLSRIIPKLDRSCQHVLVHTGQNYAEALSDIFFKELRVRAPDHSLGVRGETFGEQIGKILIEVEKGLLREQPDRLLVLGDTNSGLAAILAQRMGIPAFPL